MKTIATLFIAVALFSCSEEALEKNCSTPATIVDLTGLDGCGFVFELADGSRLEPLRLMYCGSPPPSEEFLRQDPLYGFEFANGKKVLIDYEDYDGVSSCMAGRIVTITCIQDLGLQADPNHF